MKTTMKDNPTSKKVLIAEAIRRSPDKSNREIAEEVGSSAKWVSRIREQLLLGGSSVDVARCPIAQPRYRDDSPSWNEQKEVAITESNHRNMLIANAQASVKRAVFYGSVANDDVIKACRKAGKAWSTLADKLERKKNGQES